MDASVVIQLLGDRMITGVERILACCEGLDEEGINWKPPAEETNSIYVLATHTMGNVRQNMLAVLGGGEDNRDRDAEFVASGNSGDDLRREWAELKPQAEAVLARLGEDDLKQQHAHPRRGTVSGLEVLAIASHHAHEHAGQAELTRDLWNGR